MSTSDALRRVAAPEGIAPVPVGLLSISPEAISRNGLEASLVAPMSVVTSGVDGSHAEPTRQRGSEVPAWVDAWEPAPGSYGSCPKGGSHLVLICDESGSVHGADPIRYRHALLGRVLDTLARSCRCGQCTARLVLFGITTTKPFAPTAAVLWSEAASLKHRLTQLPSTGSYLRPAMDLVEAEKRIENAVTVCLTDLELFDDSPRREEARFAAQPNPLLVLLGGTENSQDPSSPFVVIDGQSERTAVADAVATYITATRPPVASPAGGGRRRRLPSGWRGRRVPWKWLGLAASALVILVILPQLVSRNGDPAPAAQGAGSAQDPDSWIVSDEGFTIPGLGGDAPRTVPMNAVWVVDPSLADDAGTLRRIQKELPAVTEYLQDYRIPGDTLALGRARPRPLGEGSALRSQATALGPSTPARLSWKNPQADRMFAVITDRPGHWHRRLASTQGGKRNRRNYIIDTSATGPVPRTLSTVGPQGVPADAQASGSIAQAVARAWGDAVGSRWLG